jgi:hypothetical protein
MSQKLYHVSVYVRDLANPNERSCRIAEHDFTEENAKALLDLVTQGGTVAKPMDSTKHRGKYKQAILDYVRSKGFVFPKKMPVGVTEDEWNEKHKHLDNEFPDCRFVRLFYRVAMRMVRGEQVDWIKGYEKFKGGPHPTAQQACDLFWGESMAHTKFIIPALEHQKCWNLEHGINVANTTVEEKGVAD